MVSNTKPTKNKRNWKWRGWWLLKKSLHMTQVQSVYLHSGFVIVAEFFFVSVVDVALAAFRFGYVIVRFYVFACFFSFVSQLLETKISPGASSSWRNGWNCKQCYILWKSAALKAYLIYIYLSWVDEADVSLLTENTSLCWHYSCRFHEHFVNSIFIAFKIIALINTNIYLQAKSRNGLPTNFYDYLISK